MKKITIGILKHDKIGNAENVLENLCKEKGYDFVIINPLLISYGLDGKKLADVIIARCELSSLTEIAFSAYLTFFDYCNKLHIPIVNPKEFMLLGQDKFITHLAIEKHFQEKGIFAQINPKTFLSFNKNSAYLLGKSLLHEVGSVTIKHPDSGRGEGIYLATTVKKIEEIIQNNFSDNNPILLQQTIEKEKNTEGGYRDIRVLVCRNPYTNKAEVVGGYFRNAPKGQFLTNISKNGYISPIKYLDSELETYAKLVLDAVKGDIAGIDFIKDTNGKYWFEEVNIAFETSQKTTDLIGFGIWEKAIALAQAKLSKLFLEERAYIYE